MKNQNNDGESQRFGCIGSEIFFSNTAGLAFLIQGKSFILNQNS